MNYIDIKVTVWNRLKFSDDADMLQLAKRVEQDGIEAIIDEALGFEVSEILFETEECINTGENGGCSTIEVFENDKLKWQNGS